MNKALSAAETVKLINPNVKVITFEEKFCEENIDDFVGNSAFIFDCVDKFKYKFILAECAKRKNIPLFFYGIMGYNTFGYIFHPPKTACFNCIFDRNKVEYIEKANSKSADVAITSPTLFAAAGIMVTQAIKFLVNEDEIPYNKMILFFNKCKDAFSDKGVRAFKFWNTDYFNSISEAHGLNWFSHDDSELFYVIDIKRDPTCPYCSNLHETK